MMRHVKLWPAMPTSHSYFPLGIIKYVSLLGAVVAAMIMVFETNVEKEWCVWQKRGHDRIAHLLLLAE